MSDSLDISAGDDLDPQSTALFLDFDGVLVDIAERPDLVVMHDDTRRALGLLADALGGAVAVVSGRPVAELDAFLAPLRLPLAGVHGLEYRTPTGEIVRHEFDAPRLAALTDAVRAFAAPRDGLLVEAKPGSVALHYRRRPELEFEVMRFAERCAAEAGGPELVRGKMVAELRFGGRSKADAVSHFMAAPPFAGRAPWFFGDDVTDEDGFARADALGGRSFRIGPGPTRARTVFPGFAAFQAWLVATANHVSSEATEQGGNDTGAPRHDAVRATSSGA